MSMMPPEDWSRKFTTPISAGKRKLRTLLDAASYIAALPRERRDYHIWTHAGTTLVLAARGEVTVDYAESLFRIVRMLDPRS